MTFVAHQRVTTLTWDYSALATSYEKRAPYASAAIAEALRFAALPARAVALDIGAGTGRLTALLASHGLVVTAVEPNAAMRAVGIEKTQGLDVQWCDATGEETGCDEASFDLVAFGSSFNVVDTNRALRESARVLRKSGWLMCLWNHRDLDDPIQSAIEETIQRHLPGYGYGTRREDPSGSIVASGHFGDPFFFEGRFEHRTRRADFIEGFRAHATLRRQSAARFPLVLADIERQLGADEWLDVPFSTRIWIAQRKR